MEMYIFLEMYFIYSTNVTIIIVFCFYFILLLQLIMFHTNVYQKVFIIPFDYWFS